MMNQKDVRKHLLTILGGLVGAYLGAVAAFYALILYAKVSPGFAQVGWIFLLFVVPIGSGAGVICGGILAPTRPIMFSATLIPLALCSLVFEQAQYGWRHDKPLRIFTVKLTPAAPERGRIPATGREFIGRISADGVEQAIKGTIPASFQYTAVTVTFAFELTGEVESEWFTTEVMADEKLACSMSSDFKVSGRAWSVGAGSYQRALGSISAEWQRHRRE